MFEKKLVHGYDAHEVLYLYCVSGAWVRASGFTTGPIRSHSENVLKFLTFLSIKGQNGSLNVTLSCQSTLYALSLLPRRRIIGQKYPHLKVVKQLLMHICQKFWENGIQRGFGMPAKDEKENGDEVEHNVMEWEEGIWQVSRRTTECQRRGKWGATIQERDAGSPFLQGDSRGWGDNRLQQYHLLRQKWLSLTWRTEKCHIDTTTRAWKNRPQECRNGTIYWCIDKHQITDSSGKCGLWQSTSHPYTNTLTLSCHWHKWHV